MIGTHLSVNRVDTRLFLSLPLPMLTKSVFRSSRTAVLFNSKLAATDCKDSKLTRLATEFLQTHGQGSRTAICRAMNLQFLEFLLLETV